jgi:DNA-directed RNA polymerase specialized sigma24 family protein
VDDQPRTFSAEELLADMRWLRRFARRLLSDAADLDDVTQEAWTVALRRPRSDWIGAASARGSSGWSGAG